jgi:Tfp pilus assembly protein PilZ
MPVDFAVTLRWPGLRMADRAVDLSEGGLAVETSEPLDAMTLVSLRLELPYLQQPVDVLGRVVWTGPSLMGIRFESSDSRVFDSLHRLRQDIARI